MLESLQRKARKQLKGLEDKSHERLRTFGLSSLDKRRLRGNLILLCSFLMRGNGQGGAGLCSLGAKERTHGNSTTLCQGNMCCTV